MPDKIDLVACTKEDQDQILHGLMEHNCTAFEGRPLETMVVDLSRKAVDESGALVGGIVARQYLWECAYVDILWVKKDQRSKGLGTRLLREVEQEASANGVRLIHLDTFDFQENEFYEKQG